MPYNSGSSNFDQFESNYDKVNRIDNKTWERRKIYDNYTYWLIVPKDAHYLQLGSKQPYLTVFLRKHGEQFGEPITPLDIAEYTIKFRCYDTDNKIVVLGTGILTDADIGEIQYQFNELDFTSPGKYYGEFEFIKDDISFTLPNNHKRILIIVK